MEGDVMKKVEIEAIHDGFLRSLKDQLSNGIERAYVRGLHDAIMLIHSATEKGLSISDSFDCLKNAYSKMVKTTGGKP